MRAGLSVGPVWAGVVSEESGEGSISPPAPHSECGAGPTSLWLSADWVLLRREGWAVNRKRVRRWYRLEGLQLRMRVRRRKHRALHRGPAPVPVGLRERRSRDFVQDTLADSHPYRILTVVKNWSRSSPVLEARFRMSDEIVNQILDRVLGDIPGPHSITVEHGTEFQSRALEEWAYRRGVQLDSIRPGKPVKMPSLSRLTGGCATNV